MSIDNQIEDREPESLSLTVEGLGPWSFSKLKLGQNCPLSFYLKYVIKIKVAEPPPSLITMVGKAAHRVIEHVILGKSIEDAFKLTRKEYVDTKQLTQEEWDSQVQTLEFSITAFRERLDSFEKKHPVKRYVQELRGGITREYEPTGFFAKEVFWRGIIDMGIQLESGDLIVLDHKTGAPAAMGLRNFTSQLDSYKILFHKGIEGISGAQAGIHFIRDGKVTLDEYVDKDVIETKLVNNLEFYLRGVVDGIKEDGKFKKKKGNHCKYCDFAPNCKAGELNDAEERSSKYFPIKPIT